MNQFEKAGATPEPNKDQPISVGVRKNPDGTLDYSRAATLIDSEGKFAQADKEYKERKESERAKKFKIPEDVKTGNAQMVWYGLRNAIFLNEEAVAKARENGKPDMAREKLINEQKIQQAMLDNADMNFSKSLIIEGMEKGEIITAEQAREKTAALTANDMYDLIQNSVDKYETLLDEGEEETDFLQGNRMEPTSVNDLLKLAKGLQSQLIAEASKSKAE